MKLYWFRYLYNACQIGCIIHNESGHALVFVENAYEGIIKIPSNTFDVLPIQPLRDF
jgi:hypothetical protein